MQSKRIKISKKIFKIYGNPNDRYFSDYLKDGKAFYDIPVAFIEKYLSDDGVLIDIGANLGMVAWSASTVAPNGKIYSFEASKHIYSYADRTLRSKENGIKNVKFYNLALSRRKKTLRFYEDDSFLAGSRVVDGKSGQKTVSVQALPLDSFVRKHHLDRIDIIKLDVEGHEGEVLKGAKKTINKFKPTCLIEFNSYSMIIVNRQLPQNFMKQLKKIFPKIYVFDRNGKGIIDITDNTDDFISNNLLNGCVDDLICSFGDLPAPGKWFLKYNK